MGWLSATTTPIVAEYNLTKLQSVVGTANQKVMLTNH